MKYTDDKNDSTGFDNEPTDAEKEREANAVMAIWIEEGKRQAVEADFLRSLGASSPTAPDADDPFMGC